VRLFKPAADRYVTVFTRVIYYLTLVFLVALAAMLVFFLTFPHTFTYNDLYWRIVVALAILAAVGTTLIPLLNALFAPKKQKSQAPVAAQQWPTYTDGATPLPALADGTPDWNAYYTGHPTVQTQAALPVGYPVADGYGAAPVAQAYPGVQQAPVWPAQDQAQAWPVQDAAQAWPVQDAAQAWPVQDAAQQWPTSDAAAAPQWPAPEPVAPDAEPAAAQPETPEQPESATPAEPVQPAAPQQPTAFAPPPPAPPALPIVPPAAPQQ
jgi:hypothetical protein